MSQTGNVSNIQLGLVDVTYGAASLGHTFGETTVTITLQQAELKVDDYGDTPVGVHDIGKQIEVTLALAEFSLANLQDIIPHSSISGNKVIVGNQAGTAVEEKQLTLTALQASDIGLTVYKAVPFNIDSFAYSNEQRTLTCSFKGVIDTTRADGDRLFRLDGPAS